MLVWTVSELAGVEEASVFEVRSGSRAMGYQLLPAAEPQPSSDVDQ